MSAVYIGMIVLGVIAVAWGLPAAHRLRRPLDIVAAACVLAGVVVALFGVLLAAVPRFFQE